MVVALALVVAAAVPVGLAVLTALGARRRGEGPVVCVLQGVGFPVTWVLWYLRDGWLAPRRPGPPPT